MKIDLNTLKTWFRKGSTPSESQFWSWMDSFWHKDEEIATNRVSGLEGSLNSKLQKGNYTGNADDIMAAVQAAADLAVNGSDLGLLKITDSPPPTGKHRGDVQTAGTYANFGGIVFTQPELDNNYGYIYVDEGVSIKVLSAKKEPEVDGTVKLGESKAVSGDEVFKAIDKQQQINETIIGSTSEISETTIIDKIGGSSYGSSASFYGWGFAGKEHKNIKTLKIHAKCSENITLCRVIVRKNNLSGEVLKDQTSTVDYPISLTDFYLDFVFTEIIENTNEDKLYYEIYCNGAFFLYRTSPATVFTQESGYGIGASASTLNTMGSTPVVPTSLYFDFDHQIVVVNEVIMTSFTSEAEQVIKNLANLELQDKLPNNLSESIDITNSLFESVFEEEEDYEYLTDAIGPQGGTYYKVGFPVGVLPICDKISLKLYRNSATIKPYNATVYLYKNNPLGELLYTSKVSSLNAIGINGQYPATFSFVDKIISTERIFLVIIADGQLGIYRRNPGPQTLFIEENGFPTMFTSGTQAGGLVSAGVFYDMYFKTNKYNSVIKLTNEGEDVVGGSSSLNSSFTLPNENLRISLAGSSVTWGDGFLQSGYVKELIETMQSKIANSILSTQFSNGTNLSNRKYFKGNALKLEGVDTEISFDINGNEVSIIQSIERSNTNASEIELYIDDDLYDTFNNFNPTDIGNESKTFTGNGTSIYFDLGKCFTYNHTVTVDGLAKVSTLNVNTSVGFTIPALSDCAVIRKIGTREDGTTNVTHYLWFKVAPTNGAVISVNYDFGEEINYEKSTIGKNGAGINECPYGDGTKSFDTTSPSAMSSGLDFRETDDRAVKTYRFLESKNRKVTLKLKGLMTGSTGTPYFIFNFATNRYFHFQNAGIGGWDLWDFDMSASTDPTRGYQSALQFNPDILLYETTPNDDWTVKGHKIYSFETLSLTQLRTARTLPIKSLNYSSGTDNYNLVRWVGRITALTPQSVTFTGTINEAIVKGDVVKIGTYYNNFHDYIEREVSSVSGNTIFFEKPIGVDELSLGSFIAYIGQEIVVRTLSAFTDKLGSVLDKLIDNLGDAKLGLLENPMPNVSARELWGYPIIMKKMAKQKNIHSLDYSSLRNWQVSQPKTKITVDVSSFTTDSRLGKKVYEFGTNGQNLIFSDVFQNGKSIYGKVVVENGWSYVADQSLTGAALNYNGTSTKGNQITNGRKPRVIVLDASIVGSIDILYVQNLWSHDSCHMNANSSKLYADFINDFINK